MSAPKPSGIDADRNAFRSAQPTVADTMRRLGKQVAIGLQPYDDNFTGELWTVNVDCQHIGIGDTLEMALADLAARIARANGGAA